MLILSVGVMLLGGSLVWFCLERRRRVTHPMAGGIHRQTEIPHQQEFELYHNDFSLCSKKVRVCLAELGIPFRAHHVELIETGAYQTIRPAFLGVNPAGILPVLVHNGHPVYESHDIIAYLAGNSSSGVRLVPGDHQHRAVMERWKTSASIIGEDPLADLESNAAACVSVLTLPLFAATIQAIPIHRILEGVLFHRIRARALMFLTLKVLGLGGIYRVGKLVSSVRQAERSLRRHLQLLDEQLADRRAWIVGDQFTLADVSWMVLFDRLVEADWHEQLFADGRYPNVEGYWHRLQQRSGYVEGVEGYRHPVVAAATLMIQQRKRSDMRFLAAGC